MYGSIGELVSRTPNTRHLFTAPWVSNTLPVVLDSKNIKTLLKHKVWMRSVSLGYTRTGIEHLHTHITRTRTHTHAQADPNAKAKDGSTALLLTCHAGYRNDSGYTLTQTLTLLFACRRCAYGISSCVR